jgi:hypothetical protein
MKEVAADVCSAAVMIYCTRTQQTCTCTIVEQSPSAGSYRGEILGAILAQLLLRAASVGIFGPFPVLSEDCDNNGVVLHGNSFSKPLPTSQTQADVLRVMKKLITRQVFTIKFVYVRSHTDKLKSLSECTQTELMNIIVDDLAQRTLRGTLSSGEFFDGIYPNEDFVITMRGAKITGPIRDALEQHWGRTEAKRFFDYNIISTSFGGTESGRRWQATPKCSGYSFPSKYQGGVDLIASSPYGILRLVICAQIVGLRERHLNTSPDAPILAEYSYFDHWLPM